MRVAEHAHFGTVKYCIHDHRNSHRKRGWKASFSSVNKAAKGPIREFTGTVVQPRDMGIGECTGK